MNHRLILAARPNPPHSLLDMPAMELFNLGTALLDGRLHFRFFTVLPDHFEFDPLFLGRADDWRSERNQFNDTQRSVADLRVAHLVIDGTPHTIYSDPNSLE